MKVPPSLDAAALSPGEIHAELETRLPYTWRLMPDSDTGLEDLTAWVWLLQDTCHRDGYAAGFTAALGMLREPPPEVKEAMRKVWRDHDAKRMLLAGGSGDIIWPDWETEYLRAAASALADSAEEEGG